MKQFLPAIVLICGIATVTLAQEAAPSLITNTLNIGFTMTDGNSDTILLNGSIVSFGEKGGLGSYRAGVEGNYGESKVEGEKETTIENLYGYGNVKKTLSARTFVSIDASALYDKIAEVDYRLIIGPDLGAYLVKNDRLTLSVETGPVYIAEKLDGISEDYSALRLSERLDFTISPTAKLWQAAEYLPKTDDFDKYPFNAEIGMEAAINSRMKLRVVLQDKYNNTPATGKERNDLTLISGLSISL